MVVVNTGGGAPLQSLTRLNMHYQSKATMLFVLAPLRGDGLSPIDLHGASSLLIGRSKYCHIILRDGRMSNRHCRIDCMEAVQDGSDINSSPEVSTQDLDGSFEVSTQDLDASFDSKASLSGVSEQVCFVEDLSSNGTFINGEKIGKNCKRQLRWVYQCFVGCRSVQAVMDKKFAGNDNTLV